MMPVGLLPQVLCLLSKYIWQHFSHAAASSCSCSPSDHQGYNCPTWGLKSQATKPCPHILSSLPLSLEGWAQDIILLTTLLIPLENKVKNQVLLPWGGKSPFYQLIFDLDMATSSYTLRAVYIYNIPQFYISFMKLSSKHKLISN